MQMKMKEKPTQKFVQQQIKIISVVPSNALVITKVSSRNKHYATRTSHRVSRINKLGISIIKHLTH